MKFLLYLSDFIVPFVIFYIVGFGILMKTNVYEQMCIRDRYLSDRGIPSRISIDYKCTDDSGTALCI